jgi:hypothetical protein
MERNMADKPKMSDAETKSLDASMCYQQGKVVRQKGISMTSNPYPIGSEFFRHWEQGWLDQHDLDKQVPYEKE